PAEVSLRPQLFHQLLKRQVLMPICPQTHLSHPLEQLPGTLSRSHLHSQDQLINEEADQSFDLSPIPICDVGPDRYIFLPAVAAHHDIEASQQRHKCGHSLSAAERSQLLRQFALDHETPARSSIAQHCRPWVIRWKIQVFYSLELLPPV